MNPALNDHLFSSLSARIFGIFRMAVQGIGVQFQIEVFWVVTPCSIVGRHHCLGRTSYLHLHRTGNLKTSLQLYIRYFFLFTFAVGCCFSVWNCLVEQALSYLSLGLVRLVLIYCIIIDSCLLHLPLTLLLLLLLLCRQSQWYCPRRLRRAIPRCFINFKITKLIF
jgi:hypothetical protein